MINEIRVDQIACASFGMDEKEAAEKAIYVVVKIEKADPQGKREYVLVFRDKDAAYKLAADFNRQVEKYAYYVLPTHLSGPVVQL